MMTIGDLIARSHSGYRLGRKGEVLCSGCGEPIARHPVEGLAKGLAKHVAEETAKLLQADLSEVDEAMFEAQSRAYWSGHAHGYSEGRAYAHYGSGCGPDPWDCDCEGPYQKREDRADADTSE